MRRPARTGGAMAERPNLDPESTQWRRWAEIDRLFAAVLDLEPARREAFLAKSCIDDDELRGAVLELLQLSEASRDRLAHPGASLLLAAWERSGTRRR